MSSHKPSKNLCFKVTQSRRFIPIVFSLSFFFLARLDGAVNLRCIGFVFPASPVLRGKGLAANHSGLGGEGEITTMNLPTTTYQLSACVASKEDSETRVKMDCGHEKRLLFTGSERHACVAATKQTAEAMQHYN